MLKKGLSKIVGFGLSTLMAFSMCLSGVDFSNIGTGTASNVSEVYASEADPVIVVLDPGHDYKHGGANYTYPDFACKEEVANQKIADYCTEELSKYENVIIYNTALKGSCMGSKQTSSDCLENRLEYADKIECDLYVSMHCNSTSGGLISDQSAGSEVYISLTDPYHDVELEIAKEILNGLVGVGFKNKGVKTRESSTKGNDYLAVNRRAVNYGYPSILIEHGFVNNFGDARRLTDEESLKKIGIINATAIANYFHLNKKDEKITNKPNIESNCHYATLGWTATIPDGLKNGTKNYTKDMQAISLHLNNNGVAGGLSYKTYISGFGWTEESKDGEISGTTGMARNIEAISLSLNGDIAKSYDVYYRVYSTTLKKWLGWAKNGENAGRVNLLDTIGGLQVTLVDKKDKAPVNDKDTDEAYIVNENVGEDIKVLYTTHVQSFGWQDPVSDGMASGTSGLGKRLEGIKILNYTGIEGNITYQVHCQTYGWMDWVKSGDMAGTTGESKRLEAIKIKLTGDLAEAYDIYYRVHCQTYGWLDWAKNGASAGSAGYGKRLEAIEIQLVKKDGAAPGSTDMPFVSASKVKYTTHVQTYGWQKEVTDGAISGTYGESKRLEGIKITNESGYEGSINYQVHCQTYGWMDEVSDGELAGTVGKSKRLEAIKIYLTGDVADRYDVYYRVHSQTFGWLGWAKNGEEAGTAGLSKRLEAIEIKYVPKGEELDISEEEKALSPYIDGTKAD